jgi:hypothetical protein
VSAMRGVYAAIALLIVLAASSAAALAQAGFDRPGRDYASFIIRSGDPAICAARCDREPRCRAWSFSYPAGAGDVAMCWLKAEIAPRAENSCCISGVKGVGVIEPLGPTEFSIDREGGDYHAFDTAPDPTGRACAEACEADSTCRAWTYARPGYPGSARCYLKDRLTLPRRAPCCVSGVVR